MKGPVKIILITFLAVIGALGVLIGGMYLFGGFKEKPVYASSFSFQESSFIIDSSYGLEITTADQGVNQVNLTLYSSSGGENILDFPKSVKLGSTFFVTPKRNSDGNNIGGTLKLYARYDDPNSTSTTVATCNILVDVAVKDVAVKKIYTQTFTDTGMVFANTGDNLSSIISVTPSTALSPYISVQRLNDSGVTLQNKKVFLCVTSDGVENSANAFFYYGSEENAQSKTRIELKYDIDSTKSKFVVQDTIYLRVANGHNAEVSCYVAPTFEETQDITLENFYEKDIVTSSSSSFFTKDYSVDSITLGYDLNPINDGSDQGEIYVDDHINFYINNPSATDGFDLHLSLHSNSGAQVDNQLILDNVGIMVYGSGNTAMVLKPLKNKIEDVNDNSINTQRQETWKFDYDFNDFLSYYNFNTTPTYENKIKVVVYYQESSDIESRIERYFYFIPRIRNASSLKANYKEGESFYTVANGESFSTTASSPLASAVSTSNNLLSGAKVAYYLDNSDSVITYPTQEGNYKVEFDFVLNARSSITNISSSNGTTIPNDTIISFTQEDGNSYTCKKTSSALTKTDGINDFVPNKPIHVVISSARVLANSYSEEKTIYSITSTTISTQEEGSGIVYTTTISNKQAKYYPITMSAGNPTISTTPFIAVLTMESGNTYVVNIVGDYDYFTNGEQSYIYLKSESYTLSGVGSFSVTAQFVYDYQGSTYWLGVAKSISFHVIERITDVSVYASYDAANGAFVGFESLEYDYEENIEGVAGSFVITSTSMQALKTCIELGNVKVSATQDYGKSDDEFKSSLELKTSCGGSVNDSQLESIKTMLNNINKDTISFSNWAAIVDAEGKTIGYACNYYVGNVNSIYLDGGKLSSKFHISLFAQGETSKIVGVFKNGSALSETAQRMQLTISDKTLDFADATYNASQIDELKLEASSSETTGFQWQVSGASSTEAVTSLSNLKYGFKYTEADSQLVMPSSLVRSLWAYKDGSIIQIPSAYYSFDINGVLTLKNLPFDFADKDSEGTYVGTYPIYFKFCVDTQDETNSHYQWSGEYNSFVRVTNTAVYDGKTLVFHIKPAQIAIIEQSGEDMLLGGGERTILSGTSNYGEGSTWISFNSLFQVKFNGVSLNIASTSSYASYFSMSVEKIVYDANSNIQAVPMSDNIVLSSSLDKLTFQTDLKSSVKLRFTFTYFGGEPIVIQDLGVNTFDYLFGGAYKLVPYAAIVSAPQTDVALYELQKYNELSSSYENVSPLDNVSYTLELLDSNETKYSVSADNVKVNFVTYTGSYKPRFKAYIKEIVDTQEYTYLMDDSAVEDVIVSSSYSPSEVKLNLPDEQIMEITSGSHAGVYQLVYAGQEHAVGIVLSGKLNDDASNITSVHITFENKDEDNLIASSHMRQSAITSVAGTTIWSYDLNKDKLIVATFTFNFADGGSFVVNKTIYIQANIDVIINRSKLLPDPDDNTNDVLKSGESIALGQYNTFKFIRDGVEQNLPYNHFEPGSVDRKYYIDSFDYSDYAGYFYEITKDDDSSPFLVLFVNYKDTSTEHVPIEIIFNYITGPEGAEYVLPIELSIMLYVYPDPD